MNQSQPPSVEERVADAMLQSPVEIDLAGRHYKAEPPTVATLILVSKEISRLPHLKLDSANVASETLRVARDCESLGRIAAILLLGAKHCNEPAETDAEQNKGLRRICKGLTRLFGRGSATLSRDGETRMERLSRTLLETTSPSALNALIGRLLQGMELGDFFALTAFLTEVNLTRPTKAENPTTAPGRS